MGERWHTERYELRLSELYHHNCQFILQYRRCAISSANTIHTHHTVPMPLLSHAAHDEFS